MHLEHETRHLHYAAVMLNPTHKTTALNWFSKLAMLAIITLACIGCDQTTKILAQNHLQGHASLSFFAGVFNLVYAENTGTVLGIGSGLPESTRFILFVLFVGILLVAAIAFVLVKPLHHVAVLAISLVVGGGIGNLIDRIIHNGSVVDFMVFKMGTLETGIFNFADVAITAGVCLLAVHLLAHKEA